MEKSTCFSRSQVIVIVCATMSTRGVDGATPLTVSPLTSGMREASEIALNRILVSTAGSVGLMPKIAPATALTWSMSNPSIWRSSGFR